MSAFLQLLSRKTSVPARGAHNPKLDSSEDDEEYVNPRIKEQELKRLAVLRGGQLDYGVDYLGDAAASAPGADPTVADIDVCSPQHQLLSASMRRTCKHLWLETARGAGSITESVRLCCWQWLMAL
jgi:hypothetical protein